MDSTRSYGQCRRPERKRAGSSGVVGPLGRPIPEAGPETARHRPDAQLSNPESVASRIALQRGLGNTVMADAARVESMPSLRALLEDLDRPAAQRRRAVVPVTGPRPGQGDHSRPRTDAPSLVSDRRRSAVPGEHPGGPLAEGIGLTGKRSAHADRSDRHRGARQGAPGVVQLSEVGGQGHIVELAAVEPSVEGSAAALRAIVRNGGAGPSSEGRCPDPHRA